MEKFPAHLIQEPTAFKRNDTMEIYNNILVFIIGGSMNSKIIQSEMHIFQVIFSIKVSETFQTLT